MSHKLHNPKSFAPAVYIPCWLIQVSAKLLSYSAKMLYGRLAQWSNEQGKVFRSSIQLSHELGSTTRQIERYIKELKDCGLIGTFHPQAGGVNHFEFYDHIWMHSPIKDQLVYKSTPSDPPTNLSVPPDKNDGTPPTNLSDINIKEIKRNKKTTTTAEPCRSSGDFFSNSEQQMLKLKCQDDRRTDEEFINHCKHHMEDPKNPAKSPYKKTKNMLGLLKKLFEVGEHFKATGLHVVTKKQETPEEKNERLRLLRLQERRKAGLDD